jgi:hypothetical protein
MKKGEIVDIVDITYVHSKVDKVLHLPGVKFGLFWNLDVTVGVAWKIIRPPWFTIWSWCKAHSNSSTSGEIAITDVFGCMERV